MNKRMDERAGGQFTTYNLVGHRWFRFGDTPAVQPLDTSSVERCHELLLAGLHAW